MSSHDAPADLNSLAVFEAVADTGGFTSAAERLGMTKARVSAVVRKLEGALGVTLFARTTRRVTLTEPGRQLHERCGPMLRGLRDALAQVGDDRGTLAGTLRISTPIDHAVQVLAPVVAEFAARHPALRVELRASDRIVDMVGEGIDVAIRLGWLRDSSLRAVRLGDFEQWVVASPRFLARAGRIDKPQDLASVDWIALTLLPTPLTWKFTSHRGRVSIVRMSARVRTDSSATLRALALQGAGATALGHASVADDVARGRLVRLLPQWTLPGAGIHAVYPPGRHVAAAARAFVEHYRVRMESKPLMARPGSA